MLSLSWKIPNFYVLCKTTSYDQLIIIWESQAVNWIFEVVILDFFSLFNIKDLNVTIISTCRDKLTSVIKNNCLTSFFMSLYLKFWFWRHLAIKIDYWTSNINLRFWLNCLGLSIILGHRDDMLLFDLLIKHVNFIHFINLLLSQIINFLFIKYILRLKLLHSVNQHRILIFVSTFLFRFMFKLDYDLGQSSWLIFKLLFVHVSIRCD